MKALLYFSLLIPISFFSQEKKPSEKFWTQLQEHCGKAYQGEIISGGKEGDGFTGKKLVMHVRSCETDNNIKIPFFVGDDKSRTWVLHMNSDKILILKHDHRNPDGTEQKSTQYGGTSSNIGLENLQMFPADEHTAKLIPAAATNVWWFTIDGKSFTYNLRRVGSDRLFTVKFDLTKIIETPSVPWGTKD